MPKDKFKVTIIGVDISQQYCEGKLESIFKNSGYQRECPPTTVGPPDPFLVIVSESATTTEEWVKMIRNCPVKLKASGLQLYTPKDEYREECKTLLYPSVKDGLCHASIVVAEFHTIEGVLANNDWSAYIVQDVIYDVTYTMNCENFSQSFKALLPKVAGRLRFIGTMSTDGWAIFKKFAGNRDYNVIHHIIDECFSTLKEKKKWMFDGIEKAFTDYGGYDTVDGVVIIGKEGPELDKLGIEKPELNMYCMNIAPSTRETQKFNKGITKIMTCKPTQLVELDFTRNFRITNLDTVNCAEVLIRILNRDLNVDDINHELE